MDKSKIEKLITFFEQLDESNWYAQDTLRMKLAEEEMRIKTYKVRKAEIYMCYYNNNSENYSCFISRVEEVKPVHINYTNKVKSIGEKSLNMIFYIAGINNIFIDEVELIAKEKGKYTVNPLGLRIHKLYEKIKKGEEERMKNIEEETKKFLNSIEGIL